MLYVCYNKVRNIERRVKKMARLTINISNKLDKEMRKFVEENNLTITTFIHMAISKYIESQQKVNEWEGFLKDLIKAGVVMMR